jgi:prophage tail gpP-like protein
VQGHSVSINNIDILWEPNKLVLVLDNFNRLGGMLLIRSVRYEESVDTGTTTVIDMTYRDAYTLQAEQSRRDALNEDDF